MIQLLLVCLILTIGIEGVVVRLVGVRGRLWWGIAAINCITNPLLNYMLIFISVMSADGRLYYAALLGGEIAVIFGEWALMRLIRPEKPEGLLRLSVLQNASSFVSGLAIAPLLTRYIL